MKGIKSILIFVLVFVFGVVAGLGIGSMYGKSRADSELKQSNVELDSQFKTVNENYMLLVREYNKLFSLKSSAVVMVPVQNDGPASVQLPVETPVATQPAAPATSADATTTQPASMASPTSPGTAAATQPASKASPTSPGTAAATQPASMASPTSPGTAAAPVADFEAESIGGTGPLEGPPPQPFEFKDKSTGEITSWEWDFGDGEKSTEQNPTHTYKKCPGEQELCTVTLTVCGPGDCNTETKLDYLWVSASCTGC